MIWARLSRVQLDAADRKIPVILPVAATEQHGPHLPLATDTLIAEAIATRLDRACSDKLLVLPTQAIGCSEHHMKFAGSLTLTHETFRRSVMEVADSVIRHGFKRILILNSHGGNVAIDAVITEQLGQRYPTVETVVANWWVVAGERLKAIREGGFGSVGHACEFETSLVLAIAPELVDMSRAPKSDGIQHRAAILRSDIFQPAPATFYRPFHELTRHGVFGKPTLASAEKGERILSVTVAALKELVIGLWPDIDRRGRSSRRRSGKRRA